MPISPVRHRALTPLISLAAGLALLAGCAATPEDGAAASGDGSTDATFPVTIHNAYGDTTIEEKPTRVAALGYADVALASALGANVVLAPQSFTVIAGEGEDPNLPYVDPLPDDTTWVNPMSINVEQVASAKPDVILATAGFTLDETLYAQLSDIAPVVTYEEQLYAATSDDSARRIATALGESDAAEALITRADQAIDTLTDELPHLAGGTFLYGQARDGVVVMLVDEQNITARFMQQLGLLALPAVADLPGTGSVPGAVDVSFEQAPLFNDAGVLFMTYQSGALQESFEKDPLISSQPIMDSRYVPVDLETATALQDPNIAAVPWLLDQLRPGLALIPAP
ncbi:ABC transporter substrate-binding protein [Microbacterium saperdae]